jgi:hypothetical protein
MGAGRVLISAQAHPLSGEEQTSQLMSAPFPPYTYETAVKKVRGAEDGWNTCNPEKVALAYSVDSYWRNRSEFVVGRPAIIEFLRRKWTKELDYRLIRLIKELWAFIGDRIAVRFASGIGPVPARPSTPGCRTWGSSIFKIARN